MISSDDEPAFWLLFLVATVSTFLFTYSFTSSYWRNEYKTLQMMTDAEGHVYIYSKEFPVQHVGKCPKCVKP